MAKRLKRFLIRAMPLMKRMFFLSALMLPVTLKARGAHPLDALTAGEIFNRAVDNSGR